MLRTGLMSTDWMPASWAAWRDRSTTELRRRITVDGVGSWRRRTSASCDAVHAVELVLEEGERRSARPASRSRRTGRSASSAVVGLVDDEAPAVEGVGEDACG